MLALRMSQGSLESVSLLHWKEVRQEMLKGALMEASRKDVLG